MRAVTTRTCLAALLWLAAALIVGCGGSGKGLIPEANAGPLRADFEAVAQAAQSGNGSCAGTEAALGKTEKDFLALPASVDHGLRNRLQAGISNLRQRALAMCIQPATTTTSTATTPASTPSQTTPATTPSTSTQATPPPSGGTPAGEGQSEGERQGQGAGNAEGAGKEEGASKGKGHAEAGEGGAAGEAEPNSGGASAGGASPGGGR